jgi:hypothetical protein
VDELHADAYYQRRTRFGVQLDPGLKGFPK